MDRKKIENIIREELIRERTGGNLAQMVAGTVDKLVGAWRETKHGMSDYVLDQASQDLKRGVLSTFALINKKVDRGQYDDVDKQRDTGAGEFAAGALEEKEKSAVVHKSTSKGHKYTGRAFKGKSEKEREKTINTAKQTMREMIKEIVLQVLKEEAPPGREDQVKGLKKHIGDDIPKTYVDKETGERKESNPYALAWAQHNKSGKPSKEKK